MNILKELGLLALPRSCAGCGAWDTALCGACQARLAGRWREVSARAPYLLHVLPADAASPGLDRPGDVVPLFPVYALGPYRDERRRAIIHWKNVNDVALSRAIATIVTERVVALAGGERSVPSTAAPISVVPAPSRRSRTRDGRFVAGILAAAVAIGLRRAGWDADVHNCLRQQPPPPADRLRARMPRRGGGQRNRRTKTRRINLKPNASVPAGGIVVVDDVLTTGATLAGCAEALDPTRVAFAVVLAAAADPRERNDSVTSATKR